MPTQYSYRWARHATGEYIRVLASQPYRGNDRAVWQYGYRELRVSAPRIL